MFHSFNLSLSSGMKGGDCLHKAPSFRSFTVKTLTRTPPFASGIFICRGACAPELGVSMGDIVKGVLPHVALIILGLTIFTIFPQIITWLPDQMIR